MLMNPLRTIKRSLLATRGLGLSPLVANSTWRGQRLLILCYHGISTGDEHAFQPEMFLPPETFARRMEILKQLKCNVLALPEGLRLLEAGKLPPRSVSITFDDGWADFVNAYSILCKYGFPATVYLTTYYCLFNRPIFQFALGYMMWKRQEQAIDASAFPWLPPQLDLRTPAARAVLVRHIDDHARKHNLTGKQKDDLAGEFAALIGFDYGVFARERLLHLMTAAEVSEMSRGGVDFQLHTHRHRTPLDRERFIAEIEQNRRLIQDMTNRTGGHVHFCYPSGANRPDFLTWLSEAGVHSATTCIHGFSSRNTNPLLLPRLLDQYSLSEDEFEAWVTGFAALMPKRKMISLDVAPE
jgi:peptidoglycan/xylan/chitin deacetylase (PgdA/CDA1 family)